MINNRLISIPIIEDRYRYRYRYRCRYRDIDIDIDLFNSHQTRTLFASSAKSNAFATANVSLGENTVTSISLGNDSSNVRAKGS